VKYSAVVQTTKVTAKVIC